MQEIRGEGHLRRAVRKDSQDMVAVVGLQKIPDLLLAPSGFRKVGRADDQQIFCMVKGVGNAV